MHYSLLIYLSPEDFRRRDEAREVFREPWRGFLSELRAAGVLAGVTGLQQPSNAVTLRLRNGQRLVEDGPYAETKEQLAGIVTIDVPDIADAVAWMWRCPAIRTGVVELRPHPPLRQAAGAGALTCGVCGVTVGDPGKVPRSAALMH
jgi:hypothetical protein